MSEIVRSVLSVPGHIKKMHDKAFLTKADVIQFDLEDSVPLAMKSEARDLILKTIEEVWEKNINNAGISLRLNPPNSQFFSADIRWFFDNELYNKVDYVCLPKSEDVHEISFFDKVIRQKELEINNINLGLFLCIESPKAVENLNELAKASNHITGFVFGVADYTRAMGMDLNSISGHGENDNTEFGHRFSYAMSRIVNVAKANGVLAIDAPYGDFSDMEGLKKSAECAKFFGMDGKWVIHPDQIEVVSEVFSPSKEATENAKKVVAAFETQSEKNAGAISIDGKMVDIATYELAKNILKLNKK